MNIDIIAGARPNFMKIASIINAIKSKSFKNKISYRLIHTGQHYDANMSESFFKQLNIPSPHYNLESGSGSQAEQTSKIMIGYENILINQNVDCCLVVGDVTSTLACSIVAKKLNVKVAHIEAGIRSGDMTMPEEINRIVTDSISDYFFTTSDNANKSLLRQGVNPKNIFFVGNTMIDTLLANKSNFSKPSIWGKAKLKDKEYLIMTLHRPANVDDSKKLKKFIIETINNSNEKPIIFPMHPRTKKQFLKLGINNSNFYPIDPLGYFEFNYLVERCMAVITDSGGITEETTVMDVPCMTLRDNTERPETIEMGTNMLLGTNPSAIEPALKKLFLGEWKSGKVPPLWDGKAGLRIAEQLIKIL